MGKKMGRPTENPKTEVINIRATKEDRVKLQYCCEVTGRTQYEIVMEGINRIYKNCSTIKMEGLKK